MAQKPVKFYTKMEGSQRTYVPYKKAEFDKRFDAMQTKAERYNKSWKELSKYLNPTRGLFDESDKIRGDMIDHKTLIDSHATNSIRKTASGMNSGITSKSRPWFRLTLAEELLLEDPIVRMWLDTVQAKMYNILRGSNIYGTFQNTYEELLTFGTGCFILLEDFDTVIRTRNFTAGEYFLAVDKTGRVNTFGRTFEMTTGQLVNSFGYERCPSTVQSLWDTNHKDDSHRVRHLIEPNDDQNADMADFKGKPYRSVYWMEGETSMDNVLDARGFARFPIVAPRWLVPTTDIIYGFGPGWDALGDVKELQKIKYDKLMAIEKLHNPPMMKDSNVEGNANLLPGGVTTVSEGTPNSGLRPAYQINPNLEAFENSIINVKNSIDKHFFTDLFTMLAVLDRGEMTAREVASREQERIMLMGPILNQLDEEMLSQVITLTYGIMSDNGLIPPPPEQLEGQEIKVQYISVLAQMQQSVGVSSIEKVVGYVGTIAEANPSVLDVVNWDATVREIAHLEGMSEKLLNDPAFVEEMRQAKQQQMQAQQALASAEPLTKAGKNMSDSQLGNNSVLDSMRESFQP